MTLGANANVAAILSDLGGGLDPVHGDSPKRIPYVVGEKRE